MDLQGIADRLEIAELLARYARGLDTKDWDLWRSVFVEDAYIDYRSAGGIDGHRNDIAAWLEKTFARFPMSQHAITNIECDIDGDTARVQQRKAEEQEQHQNTQGPDDEVQGE